MVNWGLQIHYWDDSQYISILFHVLQLVTRASTSVNARVMARIPLFFLTIVASLGLLMRLMPHLHLNLPFAHIMHAHSHVGFQGWVYMALFVLITKGVLEPFQVEKGNYKLQFRITTGILIAMLAAFLYQGYGALSIALSTAFQAMNYWFMIRLYRDLKGVELPIVSRYLKMGIGLGVLSTLAPYVIGYLSASDLKESVWYSATLYSFFHLQYNGWFLFSLIGVVYHWLFRRASIQVTKADYIGFQVLVIATIFGVTLSTLGLDLGFDQTALVVVSVLFTLASAVFFIRLWKLVFRLTDVSKLVRLGLQLFVIGLLSKMVFQIVSAVPAAYILAFENRFTVLFYLHWCFLVMLCSGIIAMLYGYGIWRESKVQKRSLILFFVGVFASEGVLAWSGMMAVLPNQWIALASALMFLGILGLWLGERSRPSSRMTSNI